ncbi:MAG: lycopene cyclase domain-containing protein [bacterium]
MSRYLLIDSLIIIFPLLLSFEKQIKFYTQYLSLLITFISVGIPFIVWDSVAASRGDWSFNELYVGSLRIFSLPLEEILFFVVVLYATMFSYEVIRHFVFERKVKVPKLFLYVLSCILCLLGFILIDKSYTSTVLLVTAFTLFMSVRCFYALISSIYYWLFIAATMILFFIFNYILTSIPVVLYGESAILGARFLTIPVEDILYNYSMLTLYLGVYFLSREKSKKKNQLSDYLSGGY